MKLDCDVIKDLMPLYVENMVSKKSCALVEEHIKECEECKKMIKVMKEPEEKIVHNVEPLKEFKRKFKRHNRTIAALSIFFTFSILLIAEGFASVTKETPEDMMGYCILYFYLLLPAVSLYCSYQIARQHKRFCWLLPVLSGVWAAGLSQIALHTFESFFVYMAAVPSIMGIVIGLITEWVCRKIKVS